MRTLYIMSVFWLLPPATKTLVSIGTNGHRAIELYVIARYQWSPMASIDDWWLPKEISKLHAVSIYVYIVKIEG